MRMPTCALTCRPLRAMRRGRPSQTVRPRAGPAPVSTCDVVLGDRDEIGDGEVRDGDRVVDRHPGRAVPLPLARQGVVDELGRDRAGCGAERRAGARSAARTSTRLVGDVEAHHRDRQAGLEDDRRGLGIGVDVELGGDGRVPVPDRAAHQAEVRDPRRELRVEPEQQGDVRQRPDRRDRDRLGMRSQDRARSGRPRRSGRRSAGDGGRIVFPMPASPWISVARTTSPRSAPAAPSATGTSTRRRACRSRSAFVGAVADVGVAADRRDGQQVDLRRATARPIASASSSPGRCR